MIRLITILVGCLVVSAAANPLGSDDDPAVGINPVAGNLLTGGMKFDGFKRWDFPLADDKKNIHTIATFKDRMGRIYGMWLDDYEDVLLGGFVSPSSPLSSIVHEVITRKDQRRYIISVNDNESPYSGTFNINR